MKNTWLVSNFISSQNFFNLFSYHDYLLKCNYLFFSYTNLFLNNSCNSYFYIVRYFFREISYQNYFYDNSTKKTNNKFLNLRTKTTLKEKSKLTNKINFVFKKFDSKLITNFSSSANIDFFFNAFFLMNKIPLEPQYSLHHNFYLFGASKTRTRIICIEPRKFFKKWKEISLLLANLCYFNHLPLIYSSSFFKRETIALNWHLGKFNITTWRHIYPLFLTKTTSYNRKIDFIFEKFKQLKISFALINDCEHHYKLLYYFNFYNWYTIGLVPNNINPWLVSFALPVLQSNFFMQFFFLKFFVLIRKTVSFQKFNFQRDLWFHYYLSCFNQKKLKI